MEKEGRKGEDEIERVIFPFSQEVRRDGKLADQLPLETRGDGEGPDAVSSFRRKRVGVHSGSRSCMCYSVFLPL